MLKNLSQLEHVIGDRLYHFVCDPQSPLSEVKDALFHFIKYCGVLEDQIKANQEAQAAAAQKTEIPLPVEAASPIELAPEPPEVVD